MVTPVERLALEFGPPGGFVALRELRGHDEEAISGTETAAAIDLLDRLLVATPGAAFGPGRASELPVPQRDRLLAAVYQQNIGSRIESTLRCPCCQEPFDVDFQLDDLLAGQREPAGQLERLEDGAFRLPDGRRFRLPTGADELAVLTLAEPVRAQELLRRCVPEGEPLDDVEPLLQAMEQAGPLLDVETDASCPECQYVQEVRFDLQHYLLARLINERWQRAQEVHCLARAYGWPLREILDLPRSQRRLYVELIERERG